MSRKDLRNKKVAKSKINKQKKNETQISIFTIAFILIVLLVFVGIYFGARYLVITLKYKQYTDKMNWYGYNELYNNKKATAVQKVTNDELLKVILGGINNNKDIDSLYYLSDANNSEAINWYNYSKYIGVNDVVGKSELDKDATQIDAVMLAVKSLENLVGVELAQTKLNMDLNRLNEFTAQQQTLIAKAVTLGIIENKTSSLSTSDILKGELNKLLINIVEQYGILHHNTVVIDANGNITRQGINIVTDKKQMPENYKQYPYIIDSIDKEIYELDYNILTERTFKNPKETYKVMGYLYGQINDTIQRYFNKILNVNYETITEKDFLQSIKNDITYLLDEQDVKQYVNYVKEHKIKLQGEATPLLPIMYNNGEQYVVRTKVVLNVLSSNTDENLLFGDENNVVKYNSNSITMYVDVPMGMTLNSKSLLIYVDSVAKFISKPNTMVVLEK